MHALVAAIFATAIALAPTPAQAGPVEDAIRSRVEQLSAKHTLSIGTDQVHAKAILPRVYEQRAFRPAWDGGRLDALIHAIDGVAADGLTPSDYHLAELRTLHREIGTERGRSPSAAAERDLLATDALASVAYHLYFGKVDPYRIDSKWNFSRPLKPDGAVKAMLAVLDSGKFAAFLDRLRPQHPFYAYLRGELASDRAIAAKGGWPVVPSGPTLKFGDRDERVSRLRARLHASGDLANNAGADANDPVFDANLENALRGFQRHHFLAEDGALGPGTLEAINVPVSARIDQIRVNLERARWLLHDLPDSFVVVNIAAYETYLVVGPKRVWSTRCQVGKVGRESPVFRDTLRYVVFNPTWTVPNGILSKDVLPPLRRGDLSVLKRKKLKVLDRQGRVVNPSTISWSQIAVRNCPYTFRQDAGSDNALGRVKLMFPNPYSVYLHDTPSRDLFEAPSRAFSSGCIRIERPLELAERVLADPKWDAAAIQRTVDSGKTVTVNLKRKLPVLLLYWTAFPAGEGRQIAFARDIYGRDAKVLAELKEAIR
jgi:murein L,D-transpeptidase YcbB/YkuD